MVKKKKEKAILKETKTRAKYKCPEALGNFMDWDNAVPPDAKLLSNWRATFSEYCEIYKKNGIPENDIPLTAYRQTFDDFFQFFSKENKATLKKHFSELAQIEFFEKTSEEPEIDTLVYGLGMWYLRYLKRRNDLRQIAKYFQHLRSKDYVSASNEVITIRDGEEIRLPIINLYLAREGTTGTAITPDYQAYVGTDLDRIRTCEVCSRIFWAKRFDSETCSPKCFSSLRVWRYRNLTDEEKAERKAKREAVKKAKKNKN